MLVPKLTSAIATVAAAALIAVFAVPAHAADKAVAEKTTNLAACVDDATGSGDFEDIDNLSVDRQDAINCLAYYGITHGRTATEFDPHSNVTRSQMALFLYRTALVAGVDLEADADDPTAMFGDISHIGDERQTAIEALFSKGIMTGRAITATALGAPGGDLFFPAEPINRAEMALYLRNLVQAASPDLFNDDGDLLGVESLDEFPDARSGVPVAVSEAISTIYEMGITAGQTANTYNAAGFVARSNMVLFITRTLAHTAVRPAGLTAQSDGATVVVTLRDRNFQPVDDVRVDVFTADIDDADDAFDRDGSCDRSAVRAAPRFYHEACEIDLGDETTDNGDVSVDLADEMTSDGLVVWVWTGRLGDMIGEELDADDALEVRFSGDSLPPPDASKLTVTYRGLSTGAADTLAAARKGDTVTVQLQLQGAYPDEMDYVDVGSPDGGAEYTATITATIPDDDEADDEVEYLRSDPVVLDDDGSGSFDLPVLARDAYDVTFKLSEVRGAVSPPAEHRGEDADGVTVKFRSGDAEPTTVLAVAYRDTIGVPDTGSARNSVRVTVLDQYGRPLSGVQVLLESSADPDGADPDIWGLSQEGRTFNTGHNGVSVGYTYSGTAAAVETLTAGVDNDAEDEAGYGQLNCGEEDLDVCAMTTVYWTTDNAAADQTTALDVLAVSGANTIMVDTDTSNGVAPTRVMYDTNDYFHVDDGPVAIAEFVEVLTDRLDDIDATNDGDAPPGRPTLTWDNYNPNDADPITRWYLIVPAA